MSVPLPDGGKRLSPNGVEFSMACAAASADFDFPWAEERDSDSPEGGDEDSGGSRGVPSPGLSSKMLPVAWAVTMIGVASFGW